MRLAYFAGVLVDCQEASGERTVTFNNGYVVQEQLVSLDEDKCRLAYTVVNGDFTHHSASMQMLPSAGGVKFVWISDFLPHEATQRVEPLVEAGCQAIKRFLESL
ncbi:SRPBCC family protein [Paenibacillus glucanolyticus]|uniref:SRPBCC family protein n=1 Tax=Paenibacillus glucanolyticus TaxID=59843 RepID=UPI00128C6AFD|nr:SRPBCC family protein [Paenibacillus glucanolyticus]MPY17563.1 SRPBCC family protein [Paenibacillus glucanolyticus]